MRCKTAVTLMKNKRTNNRDECRYISGVREKDNEWSSVLAADHAAQLSKIIRYTDKRDEIKNRVQWGIQRSVTSPG